MMYPKSKAIFRGLQLALLSPVPVRILCVFGTYKACRDQFYECAQQVENSGQGFCVKHIDRSIITPNGSRVMFQVVGFSEDFPKFQGLELHDFWVEDGHPFREEVIHKLACRVRL